MAGTTVTSYTAARMFAIEQASIVAGRVANGILILRAKSGDEIVAGDIRGPKGDRGEPGGIWDATAELRGAIKLAGNIGGTADLPVVTGELTNKVDFSKSIVKGSWVNPANNQTQAIQATGQELLQRIAVMEPRVTGAVQAAGKTKTLFTGTSAEYLALPETTRNAVGFVAIIP